VPVCLQGVQAQADAALAEALQARTQVESCRCELQQLQQQRAAEHKEAEGLRQQRMEAAVRIKDLQVCSGGMCMCV
jgi:hypothetical protein